MAHSYHCQYGGCHPWLVHRRLTVRVLLQVAQVDLFAPDAAQRAAAMELLVLLTLFCDGTLVAFVLVGCTWMSPSQRLSMKQEAWTLRS